MEKITFHLEGEEDVEFFVLEQTRLGGVNYILVADSEEDEATALIMKEVAVSDGADAEYVIVDDDAELDAVAAYFEELLEDFDLEKE